MPAHRLDHWLDAAVHSVLASEEVDLELIVALDGIGESSPAWDTPPDWASDARVRVLFSERHRGPVATSQAALEGAAAPLIARMDSDDLCLPQRLAVQARYLAEHPDAVAVYASIELIDEHDEPIGWVDSPAGADVRRELLLYNFVPHPTLMMRREAARAVGGYDQRVTVMEDYVLALSLGRMGRIAKLEQPLLRYRLHTGQTSKAIAPYGPHIRAVLDARHRLAKVLGIPPLAMWSRDAAWLGIRWWRRIVGGSQIAVVRSAS